ncbi:hypothetical protein P171DRAFT_441924 [Karstenula rhodostoma CBS 690.94]|uniref:Uncharacterized protein n=1 Tax=Karstenula rhodostoma CBS 690.94 TaxID=1392251 RepID=A0A9P4PPW5_9PLEO|nr:hypothetical protein P171DRAFT_441924 [Karstenula rhodostoma CBS 690.94]
MASLGFVLPAEPNAFAGPLGSMDPRLFYNTGGVGTGFYPSSVDSSFPTNNPEVQSDQSAIFCGNGGSAMARSNAQVDTFMEGRQTDGIATWPTTCACQDRASVAMRRLPVPVSSFSNPIGSQTKNHVASRNPSEATTSKIDQNRVVQDLIAFASEPISEDFRASYWKAASANVARVF